MTIYSITVADATNPVEVQTWLDAHTDLINWRIVVSNGIFYILCD